MVAGDEPPFRLTVIGYVPSGKLGTSKLMLSGRECEILIEPPTVLRLYDGDAETVQPGSLPRLNDL